ncbi:four-helix bundle copper-binding protein [Tautonia sociabilis]|uniref:Four-helix bundle copper-binding protein n=1 Tax=Tautonia sociabilis TaxID=2080755 RepID=A0A432ME85_9BACT|nr:four-helix bundle copper-binding protein [Tautonia sociabilis]
MQQQTTTAGPATRNIPTDSLRDCITECQSCHAVCTETVNYCLEQGGRHAEPGHVRLLLDCAEICQTSANFMLRGSPLHVQTCAACAEVCEACAADCEQMGQDQPMRRCAEACRRCAESCRRMAQMTH